MLETNEITVALPKGRLEKLVRQLFADHGIHFEFEDRKLTATSNDKKFRFFLVKNSDLPTYVRHGIAGIGICGEDVIYESGTTFTKVMKLDCGNTRMCLAGKIGTPKPQPGQKLKVASKFTHFAADYYNSIGTPIEIIKLNGSVELAPVLGLTDYIVDLVETGSTLVANQLEIIDVLKEINVYMIVNPSYYKMRYKEIDALVSLLTGGKP